MNTAKIGYQEDRSNAQLSGSGTDINGFSDEHLIKLIAEGREEKAFKEILARYKKKIFLAAFKITKNYNDAEDILQDVSLTLYRKAHTFRRDSKFSTWLYRLVINEAISRLRKTKKNGAISLDNYMLKFNDEGRHIETPLIDWSQDVENRAAAREMLVIVEKAIGLLSPLDRSIVVLSEIEELTNPEIGQVLGMTVAAVKGRLHRARLFLRGKVSAQPGY
ncbi:MAG: sigma-70 family RNA polymerase sigma factor [Deltaproteobacteria bacterium]